jgi:hypothetical protein
VKDKNLNAMKTRNFFFVKNQSTFSLRSSIAFIIFLFSTFSSRVLQAQVPNKKLCGFVALKANQFAAGAAEAASTSSTGFSGTGANIDVVYQRLNWRINPDSSKGIKGVVTIYFVTTQANVSQITFDLNSTSFNNASFSVKYHGSTITASFPATNIFRATLPAALPISTLDSIVVNYNGVPPAVNMQAEGYQKKVFAGNNYIYTLAESYEDRDWWPCKADMQDKIDSMDIIVNVPNTFWVATNGKLVDSTITGADRNFVFKTRYPIASYLVAVAVAKYNRYYRGTVNIGGTNVPVVYNIFSGKTAGTYTSILSALDKSILELQAFSSVYGDYPFKDEKHGFYEFGWGGGMEHQTFSAMGSAVLTDWSTIAHELGHQWWGDKVTFATWNDLWLAEGFAKYSEVLAAELVPSLGQNPITHRTTTKTAARGFTNDGIYIPAATIATSNTLWNSNYGTTVYERGAMVVSMLRALLGDTKFFQACQNYLNDPLLEYGSATTDDLKRHMNAAAGYDLTNFFNDWIYGTGNPDYTVKWGVNGNKVIIKLVSQTRSAGSTVAFFDMPVALTIKNAAGTLDTTVIVFHQNGSIRLAGNGIGAISNVSDAISFNLSFPPSTGVGGVVVDRDNVTMANGTTTYDAALNGLLTLLNTNITDFSIAEQPTNNQLELTINSTANKLANIVLEKSLDGIHFSELGTMNLVSANGNVFKYNYKDFASSNLGTIFYRAKVLTIDEGIVYSTIIKSSNQFQISKISISPNPANNYLTINMPTTINKNLTVALVSVTGQVVLQQKFIGQNNIKLNIQNISKGNYWVKITTPEELLTIEKIMVTH